jgi:hypothetical protein
MTARSRRAAAILIMTTRDSMPAATSAKIRNMIPATFPVGSWSLVELSTSDARESTLGWTDFTLLGPATFLVSIVGPGSGRASGAAGSVPAPCGSLGAAIAGAGSGRASGTAGSVPAPCGSLGAAIAGAGSGHITGGPISVPWNWLGLAVVDAGSGHAASALGADPALSNVPVGEANVCEIGAAFRALCSTGPSVVAPVRVAVCGLTASILTCGKGGGVGLDRADVGTPDGKAASVDASNGDIKFSGAPAFNDAIGGCTVGCSDTCCDGSSEGRKYQHFRWSARSVW